MVTLVTTAFEKAARLRTQAKAMPQHRLVLVSHPMASKSAVQLEQAARDALPRILAGLTEAG